MFRQSLRRCAPLRPSALSAPAVRIPYQARIIRRSTQGLVTTLPTLRKSFHQTRLLGQEAAIAEDASVTETAPVQEATHGGDPNTPSAPKTFRSLVDEGVHPQLIRAIIEGMGYENMTEVQEKTLQAALQGKDLVAQARTGTGKTLAFLIPIIQRMLNESPELAQRRAAYGATASDIRGIIISPTRELAEQIAVEAKNLVRHTGIMVHTAVGGSSKRAMLRDLQRRGCHLLVATPGRLLDLLEDSTSGVEAPNLAAMVLDEADRILDVGFAQELDGIMKQLPDPKVKERQTLLFSATIPKSVVGLTRKVVRRDQFEFVQTIRPDEELTHEKVPQKVAVAKSISNIWPTLYELMDRAVEDAAENGGTPFKAIVYLPTTALVQVAADVDYLMRRNRSHHNHASNVPGFHIHGKLTQERRTMASDHFRKAKSAILFSSDVTARGMDFPNVSHVIQVGLPPDREQYIHRLGRTGRQDKAGKGWLIITDRETPTARSELAGFPISPDTSLTNARADINSEEAPSSHVEEVKKAFSRVHRRVLSEAYLATFGQVDRHMAQRLLDEMNDFTRHVWGWTTPPFVSQSAMQRRGLAGLQGWNFNDSSSRAGGEQQTESDDPFDDFVSRADGDRRQGGRYNDRGFGGGRSGDGGFGSGRPNFRGRTGGRDRGIGGGRDRGSGGGRDGGRRGGWGRASSGEDFGRASF